MLPAFVVLNNVDLTSKHGIVCMLLSAQHSGLHGVHGLHAASRVVLAVRHVFVSAPLHRVPLVKVLRLLSRKSVWKKLVMLVRCCNTGSNCKHVSSDKQHFVPQNHTACYSA